MLFLILICSILGAATSSQQSNWVLDQEGYVDCASLIASMVFPKAVSELGIEPEKSDPPIQENLRRSSRLQEVGEYGFFISSTVEKQLYRHLQVLLKKPKRKKKKISITPITGCF